MSKNILKLSRRLCSLSFYITNSANSYGVEKMVLFSCFALTMFMNEDNVSISAWNSLSKELR